MIGKKNRYGQRTRRIFIPVLFVVLVIASIVTSYALTESGKITITTPDEQAAVVGEDFDMMDGVSAQDDAGNDYTVSIQSVTAEGEDYSWDESDMKFRATEEGSLYTVTYAVMSPDDPDKIYTTKTVEIPVQSKESITDTAVDGVARAGIGSVLDGDYAYMEGGMLADSTTQSGFAVRTGTAPFDTTAGDGDDTTDLDNTVRSFDSVTYSVKLENYVYSDAPYDHYKEGTMYFEFIIPEDSTRAMFAEDSMTWLKAKKDVTYSIQTQTINGKESQVLKGSFTWEPGQANPSAIGEADQTLNIAVRVLAMTQGETLQPEFTFWLDGNEVPDGIVTGNAEECSVHGRVEPITITPPEVTVRSYPRYNVQLALASSDQTQYKGTFDFDTGNSLAANYGKGKVSGRLMCYGVTLQMYGKTAQHGLRGMELPSGTISFELDVSSVYKSDSGTNTTVTNAYTPLLWSYEGNNLSSPQADGREIPSGLLPYAVTVAPGNKGGGGARAHCECHDGGTWKAVQNGSTISVTVSDYEIDLKKLPQTNLGNSDASFAYYEPSKISGYWDVQKACFSAGEFWILQPFYELDGTNSTYIVDELGSGTFTAALSDKNLQASTVTGREYPTDSEGVSNQGNTQDDNRPATIFVSRPGAFIQEVIYKKYKNTDLISQYSSLIYNTHATGKDWATVGSKLSLHGVGRYTANDAENRMVAANYLVKFDDKAIELEGTSLKYTSSYSRPIDDVKVLYAAKQSNPTKGWDNDTEMKNAVEGDLIYYSSLADLESDGYVCVAALIETRGLSAVTTLIKSGAIINAHVKNDSSLIGNVYMITQSSRAWTVTDLEEKVADYFEKAVTELTDEDYNTYVKTVFPSIMDPAPVSTNPSIDNWNAAKMSGLENYEKAYYDENGYAGGHTGDYQYGDSLYIAGYTTEITKSLEQKVGGNEKEAYNMDANQRIADFVLYPTVELSDSVASSEEDTTDYKTTIYVKDVLPDGLTYIPGSAYIGGTYTQNGSQGGQPGTITGGQQVEPDRSLDGKTLTWTFTGQTVGAEMPAIHFAVEIGTPSNQATDVINNQHLKNTAYIWGDDDTRDATLENGNKAEKGLNVSKNNAISISKYATNMFAELDEPIEYILNVGNNGDNPLNDIVALESLPYDGDSGGSRIAGTIIVDSFQLDPTKTDLTQFRVFYTTQLSERGKTSADYTATEIRSDGGAIWTEVTVNADGTIPELNGLSPVAVAMVGSIPGQKVLNATVKLKNDGGEPGDYLVNRLSRDEMLTQGRGYLVERRISGVTWVDLNKDGERQDSEPLLPNVKVVLYKDGVYYADTLSGSDGSYEFNKLPAGTYQVVFESSTVLSLSGFEASPVEAAGVSNLKNSNGVPTYDGNGILEKTTISNIVLPAKAEMTNYLYESKHHDSGFSQKIDLYIHKLGQNGSALKGAEFDLYTDKALSDKVNEASLISDEEGNIIIKDLYVGVYYLVETKAPFGYQLLTNPIKIEIVRDEEGLYAMIDGTEYRSNDEEELIYIQDTGSGNGEIHLTVKNQKNFNLPVSGGAGLAVLIVLALAGISFLSWTFIRKRSS